MTNQKELPDKIIDWLGSQGYPLEMKVASAFQEVGLSVLQSTYYKDPETKKKREFDVVARSQGEWVDYFILTIQFAISCKKADRHPWIVFTGDGRASDLKTRSNLLVPSPGADRVRRSLWRIPDYHDQKLLHRPLGLGYGITEAFTSGADMPYEALMSTINFADASINDLGFQEKPKKNEQKVALYSVFTVPIVVISGKLFEVKLQEDGNLDLQEVSRSIVAVDHPLTYSQRESVEVIIATEDEIAKLANEASQLVEFITDQKELQIKSYEKTLSDGPIDKSAPRIW